jgi:hypothetical protein
MSTFAKLRMTHPTYIAYKYRTPASIVVAGIGAAQEAWHRQEDRTSTAGAAATVNEENHCCSTPASKEKKHAIVQVSPAGPSPTPVFKLANRRWQCKVIILTTQQFADVAKPFPPRGTTSSRGSRHEETSEIALGRNDRFLSSSSRIRCAAAGPSFTHADVRVRGPHLHIRCARSAAFRSAADGAGG